MKTITIFVVCVGMFLISANTFAQNATLNSKTSFSAPQGFIKKTDSEKMMIAKGRQIKAVELPKELNKASYAYGDLLVTLSSSEKAANVDLAKLKKGLDEFGSGSSTYSSKIVDVNGIKALVIENSAENKIRFYATNASGTSLINGLIEFEKENKSKASQILPEILKNIVFKQ